MMHDLWGTFLKVVDQQGSHEAIRQGSNSTTYEQLYQRATQYACWLESIGGDRYDRVILWMDNSIEMAASILGCWARGSIPVFINPSSPASHLLHAIELTQPLVVLHDPATKLPRLDLTTTLRNTADIPSEESEVWQPLPALPTDPASIVFTSGSTGKPKGVVQSHLNLIAGSTTVYNYLGLNRDDRLLCPVPWSFDYGYGQFLLSMLHGVTHVLTTAMTPFAVCESIETDKPTVLAGLPSLLTFLIRGVSPIRQTDISSIRMITNSGGTVPDPILRALIELFPRSQIYLNYGLTESFRSSYLDPPLVTRHPKSIGRPITGVDLVVVRDDGQLAAPNEVGEIVHRGHYIFLGYWGDPEATNRSLRPDPLAAKKCAESARALFTGDLGYRDSQGLLYFSGRRDHQLKSMGVRVSPGEIEELLHQSDMVKEVAVFGIPHPMIGDEVWAAVVPVDGQTITQGQLKKYARKVMSQYMTPQRYLIMEALPKTSTGKIDYLALKRESTKNPSAPIAN